MLIQKKALRVLDIALDSADWKERLTAARIVLGKISGDEDAEDDLDIYDTAMRQHDERQKGLGALGEED